MTSRMTSCLTWKKGVQDGFASRTTGRRERGKTLDFYRRVSPDFVGVAVAAGAGDGGGLQVVLLVSAEGLKGCPQTVGG